MEMLRNQTNTNIEVKRGDLVLVNLGDISTKKRSEQAGFRVCVVVSNDAANRFSPVIQVAPMTSQLKRNLPTHVDVEGFGLLQPSTILAEQTTSISKERISRVVGRIDSKEVMNKVNIAMMVSFGLIDNRTGMLAI